MIMEQFHLVAYVLQIAVPVFRKCPIPIMSHLVSDSCSPPLPGRCFYTVWQIAVPDDINSFSVGQLPLDIGILSA